MNKQESKVTLGSMLRRALALVLVLSLVVIPVQFPGVSNAVEENAVLTETYFSEDFSADEEEHVKFRWNENFVSIHEERVNGVKYNVLNTSAAIEDGVYRFNQHNGNTVGFKDYVYLSAMQGEEDLAQGWKNYSVSADIRMDPKTAGYQDYSFTIMLYMNELGEGYGLRADARNEVYLVRYYYANNKLNASRMKYFGINATGNWIHVDFSISNVYTEGVLTDNQITISVYGYDYTGTYNTASFANLSVANDKFTDDAGVKAQPFIESGSIGVLISSYVGLDSGYNTVYSHELDNVVVKSLPTEEEEAQVLFADDFSDSRNRNDMTNEWNDVSYSNNGEFRFVERYTTVDSVGPDYYTGSRIQDGKYYLTSTGDRNTIFSVVEKKNAQGEYEPLQLTDFTLEMDFDRLSSTSNHSIAVYARYYWDAAANSGKGAYMYYAVQITNNRAILGKTNSAGALQVGSSTALYYPPSSGSYFQGAKLVLSFTTLENGSVQIDMAAYDGAGTLRQSCSVVDDSPLGAGTVGVGTVAYSGDTPYIHAIDNLKVTSNDEVVFDEGFDQATGPIVEKETVDLRWNSANTNYSVADRWAYKGTNSKVLNVKFDNPAAGEVNEFRMDLEMTKDGVDVSKYFADGALTIRTWMGDSKTPENAANFANAGSYNGKAPTEPLSTGMLIRVMPVYDAEGNLLGHTYYRIRVSLGYIYFDKNVYDAETGEFSIVTLGSQKLSYGTNENYWHMFTVRFAGNTVTVYHKWQDAHRRQPTAKQSNIVFTDTTENPYLFGGVALWAQAEHKDLAEDETIDWNVNYDLIYLFTGDAETVMFETFGDDNNTKTFLGAAAQSDAYYITDTYFEDSKSGKVAYTFTDVLNEVNAENWNVVDGALVKGNDKTSIHFLNANVAQTNEAFGWANYGVSAKFQLAEGGYAGIVLNYNGTTGYELRFNGATAGIYKIVNNKLGTAPLAEAAQVLAAGEWITVSIKLIGDTLVYTINGNTVTLKINENEVLTEGTIGLTGSKGVQFDDISVYSLGGAPTFNVIDGWVYCKTLSVVVTDDDLVSFTLTDDEGKVTEVTGTSYKIDRTGKFTLTAKDLQGHETTINVTVLSTAHKYEHTVFAIARPYEYTHGDMCIYCNHRPSYHTAYNDSSMGNRTCRTSGCDFTFYPAEYNGTAYATIQHALNAAYTAFNTTGEEQTVKLTINQVVRGLELRPGIKLDLAGYYLNTIDMVSMGQIIDSGRVVEGETVYGGLRTTNGESAEPVMLGNDWLALLDKTTGYYRFFEYNFENLGVKEDGEFNKFGLRLTFTNADAYDLLLDNDVQIGFAISWTGLDETLYYTFKASTVETYVNAVKAKLEAEQAVTTAMILKVRELDKINQGYPGEMIVAPMLISDVCGLNNLAGTTVDANPL